jgi:hypothetical protein
MTSPNIFCGIHSSPVGELGFFDFYIIPLAKKLATCGVFGVSSDEYFKYAEENRAEWQRRGEKIVEEMSRKARERYRSTKKQKRRSSLGH